MTVLRVIEVAAGLAAFSLAALRWLRVAQREHYLPGSVLRFALRWWGLGPLPVALFLAGVAATALGGAVAPLPLVGALVAAAGPLGLGLRGRTSPLAFTRRLRALAALSALLALAVTALGLLAGWAGAAIAACAVALAAPLFVDGAGALLAPFEERAATRYVRQAERRLGEVRPRVVAITGSYGKTTTKGYVAHLLSGHFQVLASPRSYNNRAGLARTVNDLLAPGTEVFVAEMGTYGPGELKALCRWLTPEVSMITAIGPVHLERFGTLEAILEAKAEITEPARASVLNLDDPLLAKLAGRLQREGRKVIGCSATRSDVDVAVLREGEHLSLYRAGVHFGSAPVPPQAATMALSNLACAVAAALEVGVAPEELPGRLAGLPVAENRLQAREGAGGATILDDTFNSNPAGTALALGALVATGAARRVVVTPGMVELGASQREENTRFGRAAAEAATDVVVVSRTNRSALLAGIAEARSAGAEVRVEVVRHRDDAVAFVRGALGEGDAVLYENDLPDHYP
ncbi:MAG TPA: UDP-N-acetylmuramoyl-tripeptide--D-alanyl-D-alanine ligase [Acidimicrobiales bacterium]|nr:UDP-N-acetylmuramoyl-tripeptide--D-alanyl-D-alanine ligase [Acidimicrobiales bacterium]